MNAFRILLTADEADDIVLVERVQNKEDVRRKL